jgi:hypothetical protein
VRMQLAKNVQRNAAVSQTAEEKCVCW